MTTWLEGRIEIVQADITTLDVDVIVNAANPSLLGGGGVDGAIHEAAGPGLLAECRTLGGARTGEVKMTGGHGLKARFVAHAVGPVWQGGGADEDALLRRCYEGALRLCEERAARSVAFPSISTGVYGFPLRRAAPIAQTAVRDWLQAHALPARVIFCCFSAGDRATYEDVARAILGLPDVV